IIITYNFSDTPTPHKITPETTNETERQITAAFSHNKGSYIDPAGAPKQKDQASRLVFLLWCVGGDEKRRGSE
ncbi:MAG: hypothetical protein IKB38_00820, partial [Clostridia bacterium]|nr:hypothetical protein [Clostridia bacterium]